MPQKIIHPLPDPETGLPGAGLCVIHPTGALPIDDVARKDVPAGFPFRIVDEVDIPTDRTFRAAWEADFSTPDGAGIGQEDWFIEQYQSELAVVEAENAPEPPAEILAQSIEDFPFTAPPVAPDAEPMAAEALPLPEGMGEEDRAALYEAYLLAFQGEQAAAQERFEAEMARWEEARGAAHRQHVKDVAEANRRRVAEHEKAVERWQADHAARLAEISARISGMEQQKAANDRGQA